MAFRFTKFIPECRCRFVCLSISIGTCRYLIVMLILFALQRISQNLHLDLLWTLAFDKMPPTMGIYSIWGKEDYDSPNISLDCLLPAGFLLQIEVMKDATILSIKKVFWISSFTFLNSPSSRLTLWWACNRKSRFNHDGSTPVCDAALVGWSQEVSDQQISWR